MNRRFPLIALFLSIVFPSIGVNLAHADEVHTTRSTALGEAFKPFDSMMGSFVGRDWPGMKKGIQAAFIKQTGDCPGAIEAFQDAVKLDSRKKYWGWFEFEIGDCYGRLGNRSSEEDSYKKASDYGSTSAYVRLRERNVRYLPTRRTPLKILAIPSRPTVIGLDLPIFPNQDTLVVEGLQIGPIYSETTDLRGVQLGLFINSALWSSGIQVSVLNNIKPSVRTEGEVRGLQIGLGNYAKEANGCQFGVLNIARSINGVQLGLLNLADQLSGVQIGIANFATNARFQFLPLINAKW